MNVKNACNLIFGTRFFYSFWGQAMNKVWKAKPQNIFYGNMLSSQILVFGAKFYSHFTQTFLSKLDHRWGTSLIQWMTDYLSLQPKPDFFNLRLRLRPPNFIAENFHLSRRLRYMVFFPLIDCKRLEMAFVLSLQSGFNRNSLK